MYDSCNGNTNKRLCQSSRRWQTKLYDEPIFLMSSRQSESVYLILERKYAEMTLSIKQKEHSLSCWYTTFFLSTSDSEEVENDLDDSDSYWDATLRLLRLLCLSTLLYFRKEVFSLYFDDSCFSKWSWKQKSVLQNTKILLFLLFVPSKPSWVRSLHFCTIESENRIFKLSGDRKTGTSCNSWSNGQIVHKIFFRITKEFPVSM